MIEKIDQWVKRYHYRFMIFDLVIVSIFLLRSAGYFQPYFSISVNLIVLVAFVLSFFLFKARSGAFFVVSIIFLLFAGILKVFQIEVWVERTGIYFFEALVFAVTIFIFENFST